MGPIILVGYFSEMAELCENAGYSIFGVVDVKNPKTEYNYLGDDETVLKNAELYKHIPIVLSPDSPRIREELYTRYKEKGFSFAVVISPRAFVSENIIIQEGCVIQRGCNISSNVALGKCVKINIMANIMHDVSIGEYTTIAPSAVVLGRCQIGTNCYIGANSTILPELIVKDGAVVGAGAVVTKDVSEQKTVAGVPARELQYRG